MSSRITAQSEELTRAEAPSQADASSLVDAEEVERRSRRCTAR